jgi:hypothetical protein
VDNYGVKLAVVASIALIACAGTLQDSEFGTAWGTNYFFPDAGCWHLSVDVAGNAGLVTIEVR